MSTARYLAVGVTAGAFIALVPNWLAATVASGCIIYGVYSARADKEN